MKDATIVHELRLVHKRCEQLTMANNMLTQSYSDLVTRVRAYENLINRGRFLRYFLKTGKVEKEIERVKVEEISLQELISRAQGKAAEEQQKKVELRKEDAKLSRKTKNKVKKVQKLISKAKS